MAVSSPRRSWLDQDVTAGLEAWNPAAGTPQEAVISPLLANLYLHPLDELRAGKVTVWCATRTTSSCSRKPGFTSIKTKLVWDELRAP